VGLSSSCCWNCSPGSPCYQQCIPTAPSHAWIEGLLMTPRRAGDLSPGGRIQNRLHDHAMVPLAFPHDMFCADIPERSPHGSLLTLRPSRNPPRRPIRRVLLARHQAAPPRHLTIPEFRPTAEIAASSAAMLHHAPLFRNEENFSSKNS
jgi:hypothetical protein